MMEDPLSSFRLEGRRAVVTGAGSGIGRATAILYAGVGAQLVISDIDPVALDATAAMIGPAARSHAADLRVQAEVAGLASAAEALGPIDIWANVAGVGGGAPILDIGPELYERVTAINMDAVYWCCAAAAKSMVPRGRGVIINVSSNAADQPMAGLSVYAMSKAAVNMMTRSLAMELGPSGVRVNAVAPGFTLTAMTAPAALDEDARQALIARNAARSPLGAVGVAEDVAQAMLYLACDASRFVTGQILRVNGGVSMPS